jgi:hypothetical protein
VRRRHPARAPRTPGEREQEQRQQQYPPLARKEVVDDAVAVGDAVVPEGRRRDHLHLDAGGAQVLHRVLHEEPGHVARVPRIRRREDDGLHDAGRSRRANTAGETTTSAANTKK